jgi:hypothetical protein
VLEAIEARDNWADEAYAGACHLPEKNAVVKILRYETAIERQMNRALDQLDRIQRRRLGDAVPSPLNVDFSVSGPPAA